MVNIACGVCALKRFADSTRKKKPPHLLNLERHKMDAQIVNLEQWKKAHPPALIFVNSAFAFAAAWQEMWLRVICGPSK